MPEKTELPLSPVGSGKNSKHVSSDWTDVLGKYSSICKLNWRRMRQRRGLHLESDSYGKENVHLCYTGQEGTRCMEANAQDTIL